MSDKLYQYLIYLKADLFSSILYYINIYIYNIDNHLVDIQFTKLLEISSILIFYFLISKHKLRNIIKLIFNIFWFVVLLLYFTIQGIREICDK